MDIEESVGTFGNHSPRREYHKIYVEDNYLLGGRDPPLFSVTDPNKIH